MTRGNGRRKGGPLKRTKTQVEAGDSEPDAPEIDADPPMTHGDSGSAVAPTTRATVWTAKPKQLDASDAGVATDVAAGADVFNPPTSLGYPPNTSPFDAGSS